MGPEVRFHTLGELRGAANHPEMFLLGDKSVTFWNAGAVPGSEKRDFLERTPRSRGGKPARGVKWDFLERSGGALRVKMDFVEQNTGLRGTES